MRPQRFSIILFLVLLILACNLPAVTVPSSSEAVVLTAAAQTLTTIAPQSTLAAAPPFSTVPQATPTNAPQGTPASSAVLLTVSTATNCRSGPGREYDLLDVLNVGETAEAVGRYPPANYWIIKKPHGAGLCWLWGQYVTIVGGDALLLPEMTPPPSPTAGAMSGIFGYVYHDNNRNGQMDAGDEPYPDFPLYLSLQEFGSTAQETQTDASGYYSFTVTPGEYWLSYAGGPAVCPAGTVKIIVTGGAKVRQDFGVLPCSPYEPSCTCP